MCTSNYVTSNVTKVNSKTNMSKYFHLSFFFLIFLCVIITMFSLLHTMNFILREIKKRFSLVSLFFPGAEDLICL